MFTMLQNLSDLGAGVEGTVPGTMTIPLNHPSPIKFRTNLDKLCPGRRPP